MIKVEDVMTRDVVFAEVPGSRDTALKIMKDRGVTSVRCEESQARRNSHAGRHISKP